jgi:hypothetical protein
MKRISALGQQIRDCVNNANLYDAHFKNHPDEWMALCVAMDTLEDSCEALEYYEDSGIGNEIGEKYIKLYGLLQAIFLQQDSIRQLYLAFQGNYSQPDDDSAWTKIRNLRNLTVGHPLEKNNKTGTKRVFISQVTIGGHGFQLIIWDKNKRRDQIEDVDLKALYEAYKSEAVKHLEKIHQAQITKWGGTSRHF